MTTDLFSVPIFFVLFRETLEAAVIVSILLAVLRQLFPDNPKILRRLNRQVKCFILESSSSLHMHIDKAWPLLNINHRIFATFRYG